jgi:hypothetical protein
MASSPKKITPGALKRRVRVLLDMEAESSGDSDFDCYDASRKTSLLELPSSPSSSPTNNFVYFSSYKETRLAFPDYKDILFSHEERPLKRQKKDI